MIGSAGAGFGMLRARDGKVPGPAGLVPPAVPILLLGRVRASTGGKGPERFGRGSQRKGFVMLVSPASPAIAPSQAGGVRDPTARAPAVPAGPSVVTPAASPEIATRTFAMGAVAQVSPGREAVMAALRARLALPVAERVQAGPPPSFKTSLIEELRRELQTPPLERTRAEPDPTASGDRPAPKARNESALAEDVRPHGASAPERADPVGTGAADPHSQVDAEAPLPRARIDLHL